MYEAVSDGVRGMSSRLFLSIASMRLYVDAVFGSIRLQAAPVSYGQAQDALAGAVCLLHEQGGLQYAVYGLTCMRSYLTCLRLEIGGIDFL